MYWVLAWTALCDLINESGVADVHTTLGVSVVYFVMSPVVVFAALSYLSLVRNRLLAKPHTALKSPFEFECTLRSRV